MSNSETQKELEVVGKAVKPSSHTKPMLGRSDFWPKLNHFPKRWAKDAMIAKRCQAYIECKIKVFCDSF